MRLSGNGRSGSTRGSGAGNVRRCTGWGASPAAIPTCSSCGGRACGRRLECRSRMRRESHVRFWEGGGVQFPSATRLSYHTFYFLEKEKEGYAKALSFSITAYEHDPEIVDGHQPA